MRKDLPTEFLLVGLVVVLVPTISEGTGCMEPTPVDYGRFVFGALARPGDDGRYPRDSVVSVICFRGFLLKGARSFVYCEEDDQWSESPTCQAGNCSMPQAPLNGAVRLRNDQREIGSSALFLCKRGFNRSGPRKQICSMTPRGLAWKGRRAVCVGADDCHEDTLTILWRLPNQYWEPKTQREATILSRGVSWVCADSKTCIGSPWQQQLCILAPKSCKTPGVMHGANWTLTLSDKLSHHDDKSFSPNTKINVTCWPGFALIWESQISCAMTGKWSPSVPTCQEVLCLSLVDRETTIPHLHSNMENRTYRLGQVVDYYCDEGYQILGNHYRACSGPSPRFPDQTWTDLDPVCTETVCPDPGSIQYGNRYLVSRHIRGNVTFYCQSGYQLRGSAVRHCLPNGKWSGTLTTCDHESFYCPNPGIPIRGQMVNADEVRFRKRERVRYECNGNTILVGSAERECTKLRTWTGEAPTCQGPFDFDDPMEVAGRMGYNAERLAIDTQVNNSTRRRGRTIDLNFEGGMEIYFVFDASGSIPKSHLRSSLDLAKALVSKIGVADGPRRARYGACVYASEARPTLYVSDPQQSVAFINAQIDAIPDLYGTDIIGKGTATGLALQIVHTDMIPASHRPDAKKIMFLFTDGKNNMYGNKALPKEQADILREEFKVQIHCIGVGDKIDRTELQNIASKPISEHLFFIEDFPQLSLLAQAITQQELDYSPCGYNGGPARVQKGRIVGGEYAKEGQWPWQVALFCRKDIDNCDQCVPTFFCGGSLIARNWVLTAAHCLPGCPNWQDIRVYTGILNKNSTALQQFDAALVYYLDAEDAVIGHEAFNDVNYENDIALLRLSRNVKLTANIRTICMPQPQMRDNLIYSPRDSPPHVAGWGRTHPYDFNSDDALPATSPLLKQLAIPIQTDEACRESLRSCKKHCSHVSAYKPRIMFCAGYPEGGLDSCDGDSGGPVMREITFADGTKRWVQIGIVSWGDGCAIDGRYGYYARLSTYTKWMQNHVGNALFNVQN